MSSGSGLAYLTFSQAVKVLRERRRKIVPAAHLEELCKQGKIPGLQRMRNEWLIPVAWALSEAEIYNYPEAPHPPREERKRR
jgi:hypothetical protein